MGWVCGAYGGGERCAQGVGGEAEGRRPLGRPRRRGEDNIKTDLQQGGGDCGDGMARAQERDRWRPLVNTAMNFRVS
jgi:hypothetical protein